MVDKEIVLPEGVWEDSWKEMALVLVNLGVRMAL